jgi:hypothetical protein
MVIEPFVRMGPLPRSLAAEANDCFMVRIRRVQPNTRLRREISRATVGSPRVVCYPSHGININPGYRCNTGAGPQLQPTIRVSSLHSVT